MPEITGPKKTQMTPELRAGLEEIFGPEEKPPFDPVEFWKLYTDDELAIEDKLKNMRERKEQGYTNWCHASKRRDSIEKGEDEWCIWPIPEQSRRIGQR